jgi:uncharacterized protein (DUF58 family)
VARRRWSFFMSPLEHTGIRMLDDWHRGLLTPMGRVMLWSAFASGLLLLGGLHWPLLLAFCFCCAALLFGFVFALPFRPRVDLERRLPPPACAGEELSYPVVVRNLGRRAAHNLVIEERGLPPELRPSGAPPLIERLGPGESAEVTLRLKCTARGAFELRRLQAASLLPTGLVKLPRKLRREQRLLVYPRFTPIEGFDAPVAKNLQPGGIPTASKVGESGELFGTRDWHEGDRIRDVHWPSYARTGRLVVKELQEEYFVRLAMVLDVEARSRKDRALLEKSLSRAAAVADALARRDHIVDIFAAGPNIYRFQAGRALAHLDSILEVLACLEPGDRIDFGALEAALLPEAERLSAVILLLMDWDERRSLLVTQLRSHGVAVRVLLMRPHDRIEELAPEELVEVA